jgi:aspartyl aminopeptidase
MPVVTKGIAKFITIDMLDEIKTQCFISNCYLLYLKPGKEILEKSKAISSDVTSGLDPKYNDKMDPHNLNKLGYGVSIEKGTGAGGKYYGNEASAEYMNFIRKLLNKAKVSWQYGEMGKVDQGDGGTIAHILAEYNMDIVDVGPPVLGMHSPFEIVSKIDTYNTYKAYKAFLELK